MSAPTKQVQATKVANNFVTSEQFFRDYTFSLDHDFEKDGRQASFAENHPMQWGTEFAKIQPSISPNYVACNAGETLLAAACGGNVLIYDMSSLKHIQTLRVIPPGQSGCVEFQPGFPGNRLVVHLSSRTVKDNRAFMYHSIEFWDVDQALREPFIDVDEIPAYISDPSAAAIRAIKDELQKHDQTLADADQQKLQISISDLLGMVIVDVPGQRLWKSRGSGFSFSCDGSFFLYKPESKHDIVVVDSTSFETRFKLVEAHSDYISWVGTSPNDRLIASSSWDCTVKIWDAIDGGLVHTLLGATTQTWKAAFSPDGRLIASGSGDKHVRIWNVESGELLHCLEGFDDWIRALAFSPDSRSLATGAGSGTLRIFDVSSGESRQFWQIQKGIPARSFIEVNSIQYDTRGRVVFRPNLWTTFVYDPETNVKWQFEKSPDVEGKQPIGNTILTTKDGLVSVDYDGAIRFWKYS